MANIDARTAKLAELELERLCGLAGAVCNRVQDDQTGWDLLVEFRPEENDVPADLRPAARRCLVQVKSTIGSANSCRMKLSNALRFANDDQPCFIVLVKFGPDRSASPAIYVRAFWTNEIASTLAAVRSAEFESKPLHREMHRFVFDESERFDGDAVCHMLTHLEQVGVGYSQQKATIRSGQGYSGVAGTGRIMFGEGVTIADLVDLQLGLRSSLPIRGMEFSDNRFQKAIEMPPLGPGEISVTTQPVAKALVVVRPKTGDGEISWAGDLFSPNMPDLPLDQRRLRVLASPFDLVLSVDGTATFRWNMPIDERQSPVNLTKQIAFREWSSAGDIEVEVWVDGRLLTSAFLSVDRSAEHQPAWTKIRSGFNQLMSLVPIERVPLSFALSLQDILDHRDSLLHFADYVGSNNATITLTMEEEGGLEVLGSADQVIMPVHYEIVGHVFLAVVQRPIFSVLTSNTKIELKAGGARIIRGSVLVGTAEDHRAFAASEVEWAERRASESEGSIISYRP